MRVRQTFVVIHRWCGLTTAAFLFVAGLTGAVIAFNHELDGWLNPELFGASAGAQAFPPLTLVARFEALEPRAQVTYTPLTLEPGRSLVVNVAGRIDPATGAPYDLGYSEAFLDPATGRPIGTREWGACCLSRKQAVPFLYVLHYSLQAPGQWGLWLMGVVAIAWALDCFVGAYLTLPARRSPFWKRWTPAWRIARVGNWRRITFDLHRASGLWLWGVLFVVAVSGVALNLRTEVVTPLLSVFTTVTPTPYDQPAPEPTPDRRSLSFTVMVEKARAEAQAHGWEPPSGIIFSPELNVYTISFGDPHRSGLGARYVYFDAANGRVRGQWAPGEGSAGDKVLQAMFPLHSGLILGLAGRIAIAITGVAVALLSVTGVIIWEKKRRGRRALAARRRASSLEATASALPRRLRPVSTLRLP